MKNSVILVSSCLMGIDTRYDGSSSLHPVLAQYCYLGRFLPVCPEQLGGLPTPRPSSEIAEGTGDDVLSGDAGVISCDGNDFTQQFVSGATQIYKIIKSLPVSAAILKERSPSCGSREIYDGSFNRILKPGFGVTTALLKRNGIPVYSENDISNKLLEELLF